MRALIVLLLIGGCTTTGTELPSWTLEVAGSTSEVTLPSGLAVVGDRAFVLRTEVTLAHEQRGKPLVLLLDCFHAPLAATANGTVLEDQGDGDVGSWRFTIPASITETGRLVFALSALREGGSVFGVGAEPRLVDEPGGDTRAHAVAGINRYGAMTTILLVAFLAIPYAAMYLLERRKVYAVTLLYGVSLLLTPLMLLGVIGQLGAFAVFAGLLLGAANWALLIAVLHLTFELERPHRFWWYLLGTYTAIVVAGALVPAMVQVGVRINGPISLVVNGYFLVRIAKLARRGEHRIEARMILASSLLSAVILIQGARWVITGRASWGGVHPLPIGISISMLVQALVLAYQHVARQRALAEANAELQRQVAERSRELGEAVAKLTARPMELTDERVVDDRYVIIGRLGAGGTSTVYEVERTGDGKRFALKLLRGRAESRRVARFAREARAVAEDPHPHLVPALEVGIVDGSAFVVMPLVDGGSLLAHKARFGDRAWALWMLSQIASGLGALHERGLVHRDLRAANVLVSAGQAKLVDAGLLALIGQTAGGDADTVTAPPDPADPANASTRPGHLHSPPHLAPELVRGDPATKASDVFAFGVLAKELLGAEPLPAVLARCHADDPAARPTADELVRACTGAA